jgi:hypothetical protein
MLSPASRAFVATKPRQFIETIASFVVYKPYRFKKNTAEANMGDDEGRKTDTIQRVAAWIDDFMRFVWLSVVGSSGSETGYLPLPPVRQRGHKRTRAKFWRPAKQALQSLVTNQHRVVFTSQVSR